MYLVALIFALGALSIPLTSVRADALSGSRAQSADASEQAEASAYLGSMNASRAARGLGSLSISGTFSAGAVNHAEAMGAQNALFHASDINARCSEVGSWSGCAENVGMNTLGADSVSVAASDFMNSPTHRGNILNPNFDTVGIGVEHANGNFWIVVRFMDATGVATPARPIPARPAPAPAAPAPARTPAPTTTTVPIAPPVVVAVPETPSPLTLRSVMFDPDTHDLLGVDELKFIEDTTTHEIKKAITHNTVSCNIKVPATDKFAPPVSTFVFSSQPIITCN